MRVTITCLFIVLFLTNCKKNQPTTEEPGNLPDVELKTNVIASGLSLPWEIVY